MPRKKPYIAPAMKTPSPEQIRQFAADQLRQEAVESFDEQVECWLDAACSSSMSGRPMLSLLYLKRVGR